MFDTNVFMGGLRSVFPCVYNIETTNACPMRCTMCPRTTLMKRPVSVMGMELFRKLADEIAATPRVNDWAKWEAWCESTYGIRADSEPSENHFFLYTIPRVLQLHGYGEPLVDKHMPDRIGELTERGIASYFSCNPSVLDETKFSEHMRRGLTVVKFSIESTDDARFKSIRGERANFTESLKMIKAILSERDTKGYRTHVVVTMLDLGEPDRKWEFDKLRSAFEGLDVMLFLKQQDTTWYTPGAKAAKNVHWGSRCLHPWMSTTVLSDGSVQACMESFDTSEFNFGNVNDSSLADIWNSKAYAAFRLSHLTNNELPYKCVHRCDMPTCGGLRAENLQSV